MQSRTFTEGDYETLPQNPNELKYFINSWRDCLYDSKNQHKTIQFANQLKVH